MAKLLVNHRASRLTLVDNILVLPAEHVKTNQGIIVRPSKTSLTDEQAAKVRADKCSKRLFGLNPPILTWEEAAEPELPASEDPGSKEPDPGKKAPKAPSK